MTRGEIGRFSAALAEFVSSIRLEDLPEAARAAQRDVLLDAFACALAGSRVDPGVQAAAASAGALGVQGAATLLGSGARTSSGRAAFVNGCHVHGLNYDANGPDGGHIALVALAPVLAASEGQDRLVSGAELLVASAVAGEVTDRLTRAARHRGSAIHGKRDGGWLLGQVLGYLGAASGAARVMGLNAEATLSALGLALMQSAGTKQVMVEGDAPAKGLYGGFACLGGVLAAALAASGVDARMSLLEGEAGLMAVFFDAGGESLEAALADLGESWAVEGAALKRWPASGVVQPYVAAAIELRREFDLEAGAIAAVHLRGVPGERDWFEPGAQRRHPANPAAAGNSVPFGVVCALVHGSLRVEDVSGGAFGGAEVASILDRTDHELDGTAEVVVVLSNGSRHARRCAGRRETVPMDAAALAAKLVTANAAAAVPLEEAELSRVTEELGHLDQLADVRQLFASLRRQPHPH